MDDFINNKTVVLLVDDEEICLYSATLYLQNSGYYVIAAKGGVEALQKVEQSFNRIDVILLDLMMPDIHGLNVLKTLKADNKTKNIPVIIQTASMDEVEIKKAIDGGAVDCINKPYNKDIMINSINAVLSARVFN